MTDLLKDKQIVVGVTGSIAIYKSLDLIRLFMKSGAKVRVIMSESAKEFISPLTFEAISQNLTIHKDTESWANDNNHIGIARWADIFVIAPATANTINKIGAGIADNLLLEAVLAYDKPLIIAPSANTKMYLNPNTTATLKKLKVFSHIIVDPQEKLLACNDKGVGAMAEPLEIFYKTARELLKDGYWNDRRVVVSGGGTIEKIDDIRYISNFSSGKMANALALSLYLRGADVCLISTKDISNLPKDIYKIETDSTKDMFLYIQKSIEVAKKGLMSKVNISDSKAPKIIKKKPYLFMAAAVSDFIPTNPKKGKIKKDKMQENFSLELRKNVDILANIKHNGIYKIGFKAETDEQKGIENAKKMLVQKNLDAVCLNIINEDNSFGSDFNKIDFIDKNYIQTIEKDTKLNVSFKILDFLEK